MQYSSSIINIHFSKKITLNWLLIVKNFIFLLNKIILYILNADRLRRYQKKQQKKQIFLFNISTILIIIFFYSINAQENNNYRSISTSFGIIRGQTITPTSEDNLPGVTQYLGIPYGVTPSGQHRFNMAISAPKWTHQPKDAFKLSSVCIQSGLPPLSETEALKTMSSQNFDNVHRLYPFLKPQSEDCLYMNLFVPERIDNHKNDHNNLSQLSVLVIIHGGNYGWGAGNVYNASILAAYGQLLVVTLNYRLGVYGFLGQCESNSCTGNAGLSDLVVALKMLSNILPFFGADPTSLTLLGWGSGAALVSLLMASPITQPKNRLFRRAILLDGSALCPWAMINYPQTYLFKLAKELQCINEKNKKNEDISQKQIFQIVRCLQEHSHQNLTTASRKIQVPTYTSAFAPIVDGQIVPNHPKYLFSSKYGALFRDIDLMIGTVSIPAHYLMPNLDLENGIEETQRNKLLRTLVRNLYNFHQTEIFDAILKEYTDWDNPKNHPKTLRNKVLAALSDALFTAPLIKTARMHSTDEVAKTSNTFLFVFSHETRSSTIRTNKKISRNYFNGIQGALSEDYIPYIFGYPISSYQQDSQNFEQFTNDDKGISRVLMQYISNFVKSGDPTKPNSITQLSMVEERFYGTPWLQYSSATREAYLEISDRPRLKNYYRNSFVGFWNSFVPQLNKESKEIKIAEEHNFLPDYFNRNSFFGVVRSYSSFHNDPFLPPPLPPTPFPHDALKRLSLQSVSLTSDSKFDLNDQTLATSYTKEEKNTTDYALTVIVAVGTGFLILNMCFYLLIYQKYREGKRKSKKRLKYQSYAISHPTNSEINYASNSLLGQFPSNVSSTNITKDLKSDLFTKQIALSTESSFNNQTDNLSHVGQNHLKTLVVNANDIIDNLVETSSKSLPPNEHCLSTKKSSLILNSNHTDCHTTSDINLNSVQTTKLKRLSLKKDQEPLQIATSRTSNFNNSTFLRPGISPTCPRHGRAAQMMIAAAAAAAVSQANSVVINNSVADSINKNGVTTLHHVLSNTSPIATLEEAQV